MRLDAKLFGLSAGVIAAVTFVLCGAIAAAIPGTLQVVLSYVLHADLTGMARPITLASFFVGLGVFSVFIGLCVHFAASLYNTLLSRSETVSAGRPAAAAR